MKHQALNLRLKGDRTYVHGSDIFNAAAEVIRDSEYDGYLAHLSFRHLGRRDCDMLWRRPDAAAILVASGRMSGAGRAFWIVESTRPVGGQYDFDEDALVAQTIIEEAEIRLERRSQYTAIEEVIALTKRLSYELEPNISGKWLFGQLNLKETLPGDYSTLVIRRKSGIPGRFNVNEVIVDQRSVGDIRFIVGDP